MCCDAVKEAIGDRFHAVLVDNGVMRLNECQQVKETLSKHLGINLTVADASEKFLSRLSGVIEPEKKRKIIGGTFIDIFEEEAVKIEKAAENTPNAGKVEWFLQGTLYPVSRDFERYLCCSLLLGTDLFRMSSNPFPSRARRRRSRYVEEMMLANTGGKA